MDVIVKGSPSIEIGFETKVIKVEGSGGGTITVDSSLSTESENPVQNKVVTEELNKKANTDGKYPDLMAGDLVGRGESVPAEFSFRASGGKSIKDGTAWIKRLKGNSVVWNQMNESPDFSMLNSFNAVGGASHTSANGVLSVTLGASNYSGVVDVSIYSKIQVNHTYLFITRAKANTTLNNVAIPYISSYGISPKNTLTTSYQTFAKIFKVTANGTTSGPCRAEEVGTDFNEGDVIDVNMYRVIDLTQMFGAGNEPTTIEEYYARKPIVDDEYAYNEGEVIHMTAEGIKSVGDNAWDEQWEVGRFNTDTGTANLASGIRTKNPIKVLPNTEYYCNYDNAPIFGLFYDADGQLIQGVDSGNNFINLRKTNFATPANAASMTFYVVDITTYNNDIMITLVHSGWKQDTDAGYQPYWEDRLMFDERIKEHFPDGMSKWDMVYNKDGKGYIVKGTGVKKLWELNGWTRGASSLIFIAIIPDMMPSLNINNGIMAEYNLCSSQNGSTIIGNVEDKSYITNGGAVGGAGRLAISDSAYNDVDSFVAHLEEVQAKLYYELAEPTIIEYDEPFNLDYKVADFGTEQAIAEQPSAPISADIIYQFNAVDMIREHELEINELQSIIATMQAQLASLTSNNG